MKQFWAALCLISMLGIAMGAGQSATRPRDNRTVFLLQASGSMLARLPAAKEEIQSAIDAMSEEQGFAIVVAGDVGEMSQVFGTSSMNATPDNKDAANAFLSRVRAAGSADLRRGFKQAIAFRPDVIWLVSTGWSKDSEKLGDDVAALNRSQRFRVDATVEFASDGPTPDDKSVTCKEAIYRITSQNGGVCVDADGHHYVPAPTPPPKATTRIHQKSSSLHE